MSTTVAGPAIHSKSVTGRLECEAGGRSPMTLVRPTADDPLFRMADQIPLGSHLGLVAATDEMPSEPNVRPFGLRFATSSVTPIPVDLPGLRYDRRRQITVDDVGAPVFGKHSTGKTSTRTSDGHKSMDSDTDHTED